MTQLTYPEWEAAEKFGKPTLWATDLYGKRSYVCIIELPCPFKGGEVKVSHHDTSPLLALIGATEKAKQMTALPRSTHAESITYAGL